MTPLTLPPGTRLGSYEIVAPLGAGGMGEIYRARDTRPELAREVAIKVLPGTAADADRRRRLELEARATGSLNHPNILAIHDVGVHDGMLYLVEELLDGTTLRDVIANGAVPARKAIEYGRAIASGLAAAHAKGVIHRDIKPENVMVTADGHVKILDFGLAKVSERPTALDAMTRGPGANDASTRGQHAYEASTRDHGTDPGTVLGTVAYMSPEQVRGQSLDARSDLFSLGVVLYELLSGVQPFKGESAADTQSAILSAEPRDLPVADRSIPPGLERIVRRCLEKRPEQRFQSASDLAFALDSLSSSGSGAAAAASSGFGRARPGRMGAVAWATAGALASAIVAIGIWQLGPSSHVATPAPSVTRFRVLPPAGLQVEVDGPAQPVQALSADGRHLVFTLSNSRLGLYRLDSADSIALDDTSGGSDPFWAPDGRTLGFFAAGKLKRIDTLGGGAQVVVETGTTGVSGGSWSQDGTIVFGPGRGGGLMRTSASGGTPEILTTPDTSKGEVSHRHPWFLPDGRHFLYSVLPSAAVELGSLDDPALKVEILKADAKVVFSGGHLVFVRGGALFAQAFDPTRLTLSGEPKVVALGVGFNISNGRAAFAAGGNALSYRSGVSVGPLLWRDRLGAVLGEAAPAFDYQGFTLSPDDKHIAAHRHTAFGGDIWDIDVARGVSTRITADESAHHTKATWSPDGRALAYLASTRGAIFVRSGQPMLTTEFRPSNLFTDSGDLAWTAGSDALFFTAADPKTGTDIWLLPLDGSREAYPVVSGPFNQRAAQVSPDGKWLAFQSDESGIDEVYATSFPPTAMRHQVSANGGVFPKWHGNTELFFASPDGWLNAVQVHANGSNFDSSRPVRLFEIGPDLRTNVAPYAPSADGQRFLTRGLSVSAMPGLTFVLNWTAALTATR